MATLPSEIAAVITSNGANAITGAKLRGVLLDIVANLPDITPQQFGAVGDGITDDTVALQAALTYIATRGGDLSLNGGIYFCTSGLMLTPVYPTAVQNIKILGPGVIKPLSTMMGTALTITGGAGRPHVIAVAGVTFDVTNSTGLISCLNLKGTNNVMLDANTFKTDNSGSFAAGFSLIRLENSVPGNSNTNCFWTLIRGNNIAPLSGPSGLPPYGILMYGQVNATVIRDNTFTNLAVGVAGLADLVNGDNSNSIHIETNFFEGCVICIQNRAITTPQSWGSGWNIWDNRVESFTTFFDIGGTGSPVNGSSPPYLHGNFITGAGNYIVNPMNALYNSFEPHFFGGAYAGANTIMAPDGMTFFSLTNGLKSIGNLTSGMSGVSTGVAQVDMGCPFGVPTVIFDTGSIAGGINYVNGSYFQFLTNGFVIGVMGDVPNTQTGATYTMAVADSSIIANASGAMTLTLLPAAIYIGRKLRIKTIAAFAVVSATSNVVPLAGGAAGTAILAATAGKWTDLQSDGVNWVIMAAN